MIFSPYFTVQPLIDDIKNKICYFIKKKFETLPQERYGTKLLMYHFFKYTDNFLKLILSEVISSYNEVIWDIYDFSF